MGVLISSGLPHIMFLSSPLMGEGRVRVKRLPTAAHDFGIASGEALDGSAVEHVMTGLCRPEHCPFHRLWQRYKQKVVLGIEIVFSRLVNHPQLAVF